VKRAIITGATGFLGFRTVKWLTKRGYSVTALGRNVRVGTKLAEICERFVAFDLAFLPSADDQMARLESLLDAQDLVVHCAALASPWGREEDFERANVGATRNLLQALRRRRSRGPIRMIHISTPSIYIGSRGREAIRESDPLPRKPINFYAKTKREAERIVDEAARDGLDVITLRPQGIFGPGDPHILPRLLRLAKKGFLPLIGGGTSRLDLTYVDNVAHAIALAAEAPAEAIGRKYNITNGEPVAVGAALGELLKRLGYSVRPIRIPLGAALIGAFLIEKAYRLFSPMREPPITVYSVYTLGISRTLSIEAARRDLGYTPVVDLEEGFRLTAESFPRESR
jgi:nucleoside-diphosphate-sugar epimerase